MTSPAETALARILTDPVRRPQAVEALAAVVDAEVQARSGVVGMALKTAYRAVTSMKPDLVLRAVDYMLPDFADQLDPYWTARHGEGFGQYLSSRGSEVADALLVVTDRRAAKPDHAAVAKIYNGLRPRAKGMVEQALPRLGTTIESLVP